jgi:hypothetical protein
MLALIAIWIAIAAFALPAGYAAITSGKIGSVPRPGDRPLVALWLGLLAAEWLCLTASLFWPMTPGLLIALLGPIGIVLAVVAIRKDLLAEARARASRTALIALLLIVLAAAFVAAGLRPTPDTGEYHYPAIRWLSEYGTVIGVGQTMTRLGYVSSLFPLIAPFDAILPGRAFAAVNGVVLCLIVAQIALAAYRIGQRTARPSDWFLGTASLAILGLATIVGSPTTSTPDLSVMTLTVVAAWRMLAWQEEGDTTRSLVPLILTCGALTAKLSGLLLVPAAGLFAVWGAGWRQWVRAVLVAALLVAPYFAAAVMASGCLALPSAASCLPVPWALSAQTVQELAQGLWEWSRWGAPMPAGAGPWDWVSGWLTGQPHWLNAAVFWPFVGCFAAYVAVARHAMSAGERWVLALIVPSIALVFWRAPDLRFNFGLFVTPMALLVMRIGPQGQSSIPREVGRLLASPIAVVSLLAAVQIAFAVAVDFRHGEVLTTERLLRPRAAPRVDVTEHTGGGIRYFMPRQGSVCWGAPLPCADQPLAAGVALRAPRQGIGGGFIKVP